LAWPAHLDTRQLPQPREIDCGIEAVMIILGPLHRRDTGQQETGQGQSPDTSPLQHLVETVSVPIQPADRATAFLRGP
jgi:hypothetical protein